MMIECWNNTGGCIVHIYNSNNDFMVIIDFLAKETCFTVIRTHATCS